MNDIQNNSQKSTSSFQIFLDEFLFLSSIDSISETISGTMSLWRDKHLHSNKNIFRNTSLMQF